MDRYPGSQVASESLKLSKQLTLSGFTNEMLMLFLLVGNERRNKEHIHIEVLDIREKSMTFKAVSPLNQGLRSLRFLAEDLTRLGGNCEPRVLGEGPLEKGSSQSI